MSELKRNVRRRISFILTALGAARKGFYTPFNYLNSVDRDVPPYETLVDLFSAKRADFESFIEKMGLYEDKYLASETGVPAADWNSKWISPLDAAALHTAIVTFRPKRIMEIGSGNSTHHMLRAILDHGLETEVTCIDPMPRIEVGDLPLRFEKRVFGPPDIEIAADFEPNDIVFVDSSHIMQEGFDVDLLFNRVFPRLKPGVIVQVHDIFLPYGYPKAWFEHRFNEQNALIGWLVSGYFDTIFASHYAWRDMSDQLSAICPNRPLITPRNGGALWLRKN